MEVKASLQYARVGEQKARLVADLVRGKDVSDAVKTLTFLNKKSAGHSHFVEIALFVGIDLEPNGAENRGAFPVRLQDRIDVFHHTRFSFCSSHSNDWIFAKLKKKT